MDDLPGEVFTQEQYYFKVSGPEGRGLVRHYAADGSYNDVHIVKEGTLLAMPAGCHIFTVAPGYNSYYLWVLARCTRTAR